MTKTVRPEAAAGVYVADAHRLDCLLSQHRGEMGRECSTVPVSPCSGEMQTRERGSVFLGGCLLV